MKNIISYKDAGVDIKKGELLVEKIKAKVKSTYDSNVIAGVGGFSSLYKMTDDRFLTAGTDGVGTKILLAQELGVHSTIGQDLVAMCVNDIICCGARPLFFMDYLACSNLDLDISEQIIDGITNACKQSSLALIGGETAEMPGLYKKGDYDLAGFAVGEVCSHNLIDGSQIIGSEDIVAIASSGFHSNGYSLLRKLVTNKDSSLKQDLLKPTKLYVDLVSTLQNNCPTLLSGIAHITGGGLKNITRINNGFDYHIDNVPDINSTHFKNNVGREFSIIAKRSGLCNKELYTTFNMGMGLVIITKDSITLMDEINKAGHLCYKIGRLQKGESRVILNGNII